MIIISFLLSYMLYQKRNSVASNFCFCLSVCVAQVGQGRVTVYTSDIFCESNISHALHLSYFFNEFETHILFTLYFDFAT